MPGSLSILLVDDEEERATFFQEAIEAMGLDAISFTDPLPAFEYFKDNQQKFSLIITDLRMPGMCGLELAKKIRELNNIVKIFLITAFDTNGLESSEIYQSARIYKILQKPIKLAVLKKIVEESLNN